jgi:hypothetical protein
VKKLVQSSRRYDSTFTRHLCIPHIEWQIRLVTRGLRFSLSNHKPPPTTPTLAGDCDQMPSAYDILGALAFAQGVLTLIAAGIAAFAAYTEQVSRIDRSIDLSDNSSVAESNRGTCTARCGETSSGRGCP